MEEMPLQIECNLMNNEIQKWLVNGVDWINCCFNPRLVLISAANWIIYDLVVN